MSSKYYTHPLLKERSILFRQYQHDIQKKLNYKNSLIVIPTSLGKTVITLITCIDILYNWKRSKVLILAPTRPLVHQHFELFKRCMVIPNQCFALTGKLSPEIRKSIWHSDSIRVYFATPELVRNDLKNNLIRKNDFYLIVFDEAHRAVKDYSYTFISKNFYDNTISNPCENPLILALSASPGSSKEKVIDICSNLFIEQILVKSEKDDDVLPYIYNVEVEELFLELNDYYEEISRILSSVIEEKISWLVRNNFIKKKKIENVYRKDLLLLADFIKNHISEKNSNFLLLSALKYQSMSMILLYCRDLIESQGSFALRRFFRRIKEEIPTSKAYQELFADSRIQYIMAMLQKRQDDNQEDHPKLSALMNLITQFLYVNDDTLLTLHSSAYGEQGNFENNNSCSYLNAVDHPKKVLIFSQYRDTVEEIVDRLNQNNISCKGFFGQSKKNGQGGLSQDKQLSILNNFKQGFFPVLVATSVAEEGLDIPNVDLVIFYEPVPSGIRFIQRKGRTGRFSNGKVIILITKNTIDSKYYEVSKRRIEKMKNSLLETNFTLGKYHKRSFDLFEKMISSDILSENNDLISNPNVEFSNLVLDSISSNSNRKIKHVLKKLSYRKNENNIPSSFLYASNDTMKDIYEISLNFDRKKIINRAQRQIHELLAKEGRKGLEVSSLKEILNFENIVIEKAIENLVRLRRVVWLNKCSIRLIESSKFINGSKYSVYIENMITGKAIVRVNDKWFALMEHYDYYGPRTLLKKGSSFNAIGEMYRKDGKLKLIIKKIL